MTQIATAGASAAAARRSTWRGGARHPPARCAAAPFWRTAAATGCSTTRPASAPLGLDFRNGHAGDQCDRNQAHMSA